MASFADERVAQVLRGTLAFKTIDYPGHDDIKIAVRLLSDGELDDCRTQALVELEKIAKRRKWDVQLFVEADPEALQRQQERQIVWRAFHDPDTTTDPTKALRFFPTYENVASLGSVEQQRLFEAYIEHQRFVAPLRDHEAEEVEQLVDALGKGLNGPAFLGAYGHSTLVRLVLSMAKRLCPSPTSKSSST